MTQSIIMGIIIWTMVGIVIGHVQCTAQDEETRTQHHVTDHDDRSLKSFKLTHVEWSSNEWSKLGGNMVAILSLLPMLFFPALIGLFIVTRDVLYAYFIMAILFNSIVSESIKLVLQSDRPALAPPSSQGSGMPSAHSSYSGLVLFLSLNWSMWGLLGASEVQRRLQTMCVASGDGHGTPGVMVVAP